MDIRPGVLDRLLAAADDPAKLFGADGRMPKIPGTSRPVDMLGMFTGVNAGPE